MIYDIDKNIEALWQLYDDLKQQPDEYVLKSVIKKPYKNFFIEIYQIYFKHLKEITK